MSKKQKEQTLTINDKEYKIDDMTDEQISLLNHINDLDRKIGSSRFNLDQLIFGKEAFINALAASLEAPEEVTE
jgi:hypothetical protein